MLMIFSKNNKTSKISFSQVHALVHYIIYPDSADGSKYTIDGLQSDTLYSITVTSTYNSGSRTVYQSVRTSLSERKCQIIY